MINLIVIVYAIIFMPLMFYISFLYIISSCLSDFGFNFFLFIEEKTYFQIENGCQRSYGANLWISS